MNKELIETNSVRVITLCITLFIEILCGFVYFKYNDFPKFINVFFLANGSMLAVWILFVWPIKYILSAQYLTIQSGLLYRVKIEIDAIQSIEEVYGIHFYGLSGNRFNPFAKKYKIIYSEESGFFQKSSLVISPSEHFAETLMDRIQK